MVFQYGLEPVLISLSLFTKLMIYVSLSPQILAFVRKYGLTLNHFFTPGGQTLLEIGLLFNKYNYSATKHAQILFPAYYGF